MKTLNDFCKKYNLILSKITYKAQGIKYPRYGWDIINKKGHILIALEPVDYKDGTKWIIRFKHIDYKGPLYLKRISTSFLKYINVKANSHFVAGYAYHKSK